MPYLLRKKYSPNSQGKNHLPAPLPAWLLLRNELREEGSQPGSAHSSLVNGTHPRPCLCRTPQKGPCATQGSVWCSGWL